MKQFALLLLIVAVAHASVTVTRTSNDGLHPSTMEIAVALPDSNNVVYIPLTRTDEFEDIPMTLIDNGVSRTFSSRQVHHPSHSHYRHVDSKSVISVRQVSGNKQMSGHFMHEGTSYFLEPVGESEHRILKNVVNPEVMARQIDVGKLRKRQSTTSSTTYTVEIQLLLDDSVWSTMRSLHTDDTKTLTELHFYYTHILNGIDITYRNIPSLSISVKCIGLTIAKTASDSKWMGYSLEGGNILQTMTSYSSGKIGDHFMAFTRKDITGDGSSGVCGMAYLSGACNSLKVSINEDQGLQSWGTAAHELGHNLGSPHDGSGNACNPNAKNLMSPSTQIYNIADVANSYRFSTCTVKYISDFINKLGSSNCLTTTQGNRVTQLSQASREGTRLTLDQVCKLSFPSSMGKFMPTETTGANPAAICSSIYCQTTPTSGGTHGGLRAPVGTPCGNRKSCTWNGECTADSAAPAADESCFWGDTMDAQFCNSWKTPIQNRWTTCQPGIKLACCKTLAGLC